MSYAGLIFVQIRNSWVRDDKRWLDHSLLLFQLIQEVSDIIYMADSIISVFVALLEFKILT